jgi:protein required for attachment to host cells
MPTHNAMEKSTWILVAQRARAIIFSSDGPDEPLRMVKEIDNPRGRLQSNQIDADRPGRSFDRAGHGRHALSTEESSREHVEHEFVRQLATLLDRERAVGAFDRLVLVAGPRLLGFLRIALTEPTRRLVAAQLNKELIDPTPGELRDHLKDLARV